MDVTRAMELLRTVAEGVNPFTGEILPEDCVCNQVEMVRAIYCVLNEVRPPTEKKAKSQPENAGKPWSESERNEVAEEYRSGMTMTAIARKHQRSRGSIEAKLAQMGLIEYSYYARG